MKVDIKNIPEGEYCCGCDFLYKDGDFRYCRIFGIPLVANDSFFKKCDKCKEESK